jgi:hypothetical protein
MKGPSNTTGSRISAPDMIRKRAPPRPRMLECHASATAVKCQSLLTSHPLLPAIDTNTNTALQDIHECVMGVRQIERDPPAAARHPAGRAASFHFRCPAWCTTGAACIVIDCCPARRVFRPVHHPKGPSDSPGGPSRNRLTEKNGFRWA